MTMRLKSGDDNCFSRQNENKQTPKDPEGVLYETLRPNTCIFHFAEHYFMIGLRETRPNPET